MPGTISRRRSWPRPPFTPAWPNSTGPGSSSTRRGGCSRCSARRTNRTGSAPPVNAFGAARTPDRSRRSRLGSAGALEADEHEVCLVADRVGDPEHLADPDGLGWAILHAERPEEPLPELGLGRCPVPALGRKGVDAVAGLADAAPGHRREVDLRVLSVRILTPDERTELLIHHVAHGSLLFFPRGRGVCEEPHCGKGGCEEVPPAGHRHVVVDVERFVQRVGRAKNEARWVFALARDRILSGLGDGMVAVVEPALHRLELTAEVGLIGGEQKSAV